MTSDRINFYVINLDRSVDRLERFTKDFEAFPIPFLRVSGIEGKDLTIPIEDYDAFMFFMHTGRDASPGEIGCYLSHLKALKMFLESGKEFALICEDDAMPAPECYEAIEQMIAHSETWDMLRCVIAGHAGSQRKSFPYLPLTPNYSLSTTITGVVTATAYIVNRRAAEILVRKLVPMTNLYDTALFLGRMEIKEATIFPYCMLLSEDDKNSTVGRGLKRKLKPWHLVFWTCRFYRLHVRVVRYSLQFLRLFQRRFAAKRHTRARHTPPKKE